MRKSVVNSFNKGLIADNNNLATSDQSYTDSLNTRLVTYGGNEFVVQAEAGNTNIDDIVVSAGYRPRKAVTYNNISYIISTSDTANKIELGTFPSPAYKIIHYQDQTDELLIGTIPTISSANLAVGDIISVSIESDSDPATNLNTIITVGTTDYYNYKVNHLVTSVTNIPIVINFSGVYTYVRVEVFIYKKSGVLENNYKPLINLHTPAEYNLFAISTIDAGVGFINNTNGGVFLYPDGSIKTRIPTITILFDTTTEHIILTDINLAVDDTIVLGTTTLTVVSTHAVTGTTTEFLIVVTGSSSPESTLRNKLAKEIGTSILFTSIPYSTKGITFRSFPREGFIGEFTTSLFNEDYDSTNFDLEIQEVYDNSVNIIFASGNGPVRIINSRFKAFPDNTFEIADRSGKDSNIYYTDSLERLSRLVPVYTGIPKLSYEGTVNGGNLLGGNYVYYFKYATQDGTLTDIIEETRPIPIFEGEEGYIGTTEATKANFSTRGTTKNTTKAIKLTLSNLDKSFAYIKVYYAYYASSLGVDTVPTYYELPNYFSINGTVVKIVHTGFEISLPTDGTEVITRYATTGSVGTIAQVKNRLFLGNIKPDNIDYDALKALIRRWRISWKEVDLCPYTAGPVYTDTSYTKEDGYWTDLEVKFPALNNFYRNSKRIHDWTSYYGGEVYSIGAVLVFDDNSLSPVLPLTGFDSLNTEENTGATDNIVITSASHVNSDSIEAFLSDSNNYFETTYGLNYKGVARSTPFATGQAAAKFLQILPAYNTIYGEFATSLPSNVKGVFFVRAARKPNAITSGIICPVFKIPLTAPADFTFVDYPGGSNPDYKLFGATAGVATNGNECYFPIPGGMFLSEQKDYIKEYGPQANQIIDLSLATATNTDRVADWYNTNKVALYSPDILARPSQYSTVFADKAIVMKRLQKGDNFTTIKSFPYKIATTGTTATTYAVTSGNRPTNFVGANQFVKVDNRIDQALYKGQANFTIGFSTSPNLGGFLSNLYRPRGERFFPSTGAWDGTGDFPITNDCASLSQFDAYVGLTLAEPYSGSGIGYDLSSAVFPATAVNRPYLSWLDSVMIYDSNGIWTTSRIKELHENIDDNIYYPISRRFSIEELSEFDATGLVLGGGDCFLQAFYHRAITGTQVHDEDVDDNISSNPLHTKSYPNHNLLLCGVTYSNYNTALMETEQVDLSEKLVYGIDRPVFPPTALTAKSSTGVSTGDVILTEGLGFNKYHLPLSTKYNNGYLNTTSDNGYQALIEDVPISTFNYFNRVFYSEPHIISNFENGYRNIRTLNYEDYPTELGAIKALRNVNGALVIVFNKGSIVTNVDEQNIISDTLGTPITVGQPSVLTQNYSYISRQYGAQGKEAAQISRNYLYGYDTISKKAWRTNGRDLELISDFKINSLLLNATTIPVILFNSVHNLVHFSWTSPDLHVSFAESLNVWNSKHSYYPQTMFEISNKIYSSTQKSINSVIDAEIWRHDERDSDPTTEPFLATFYGTAGGVTIEFIVVDDASTHKIFDNLKLIDRSRDMGDALSLYNPVRPTTITFNSDTGRALTQPLSNIDVVGRLRGNAHYKEGHWYIVIGNATYAATPVNRVPPGQRIRDKWMRIKFIYPSDATVNLSAVQTLYRISYS